MYSVARHLQGDTKGAITIMRKALKHAVSSEDISLCWGRIGDYYHELQNDAKAFKAYRSALDYNPENVEVLNNYAYYLSLRDEELQKALAMAQLAITLEEDNYNYIDTYAWVLHRLGRNDEAKRYMRQALSLCSQRDANLLMHYADILWALGEEFMANTYWQKAVAEGYDKEAMEAHIVQIKSNKE
jgi:Tfp pilus assembly protein PilF